MQAAIASSLCDLSISIVSFNTRDLLELTTQAALADLRGLEGEIIVVDNASTDGSQLMVRERFPSVRLIANADNRFLATSNNQAVAARRGRYALIPDYDVGLQLGTVPAHAPFQSMRHSYRAALIHGFPLRNYIRFSDVIVVNDTIQQLPNRPIQPETTVGDNIRHLRSWSTDR